MSGNDQTAGNEFDAWMGAGPTVKAGDAAPPPETTVDTEAAPANRKGKGQGSAVLAGLARKPLVLIPAVLAVAVIGLSLVRGGGSEPTPTESQYAAIATAPADPPAVDSVDQEPTAYDLLGPSGDEATVPLDASPEAAPEQAAVPDEGEAGTAASAGEPAPEPAVTMEAQSGTEAPSRHELELRIEALENDLDRAQQTRQANLRVIRNLRSQVEKLEGQGSYSVVAVLNDGVVVRDGSGSERVYGLGARIGE